jgi:beta-phosphoglucomutase-like phosphatase (HAD superfamily)
MKQAYIFDVDGTLADTERDGHRIAFNQAFEASGLDWYWGEETYAELLTVTGGKERMKYYVESHHRAEQSRADLDDLIKQLHALKTEKYVALLEQNAIPLRPGVKRLLDEARAAGIRLAIATTTTPQNVTALLKNALGPESIDWFEVIGAGDIVPHKKPAPDIYQYVLQEMNLKPEHCIAFEDSLNGIRSSRAAQLDTIVTYNGYTRNDDFTGAIMILDQLGERDNPSQVLKQNGQHSYLTVEMIRQIVG